MKISVKNLLISNSDHILEIRINRPNSLNALNRETIIELTDIIKKAQKDKTVKSILITGVGKSFVAGADIKEFLNISEKEGKLLASFGQAAFKAIENCTKPVLAAINGYALGGGCELAMCCHLRIASANAVFGQPEVKLGIIAGYGGTQRLIQYIGKAKAMELHLTGNSIKAEEALRLGLINYVVPHNELLARSRKLLNEIITHSPKAIEGIIKSINSFYEANESGFENEINEFGKCFLTSDSREGIKAFIEKRKPVFKGK